MGFDGYMSFVVRLWCDPAGSEWRGEVEHIQSGNRWSFASLAHLLDFLRLATDTPYTLTRLLADHDDKMTR